MNNTNTDSQPATGPGSHEDEKKALLQLVTQFEAYTSATGLSHLMALLIADAQNWRWLPKEVRDSLTDQFHT
jgi:hypothetical protein